MRPRLPDSDMLVALGIITLFVLMTWSIVSSAAAYRPEAAHVPRWSPPPIPACDKPAWERIVEGCAEPEREHLPTKGGK